MRDTNKTGRYLGVIAVLAVLLLLFFPIPRLYRVNKSGTVIDAIDGKPLKNAVVAFGFQRRCASLGGGERTREVLRITTDDLGRFQLKGTLFSLDFISVALLFSGCLSESQEYVCKEGYSPKTTLHGLDHNRQRKTFSPIEEKISLTSSTTPFKSTSQFNLIEELYKDCAVDIDFGSGLVKKKIGPG